MTSLAEPKTRFAAPADTTAPAPAEHRGLARDGVRLLVATDNGLTNARFHDLPAHLAPGDLVVVNDSATEARQVDAELLGRGAIVLHLATDLRDGRYVVELRTAPRAERAILDAGPGDIVRAGRVLLTLRAAYPGTSSPTGAGNRLWLASADGDLEDLLRRRGRPISYGYLERRLPLADYQTIFAARPGSAEMPSAGRPFTHSVVQRLRARGVAIAKITLHTGVSSQEAGEGPQPEWFHVPGETARAVNATRLRGGRVVAVGTTVTRALESAVGHGQVAARWGWTSRVVTPTDPPRVVDGLITGWHDPHASHLLLVEAVAGPRLTQAAYDEAVAQGYLWHEFGDSALLLP